MHDPSTVAEAGGKFYVYATGSGLLAFQSDNGWRWPNYNVNLCHFTYALNKPTSNVLNSQ